LVQIDFQASGKQQRHANLSAQSLRLQKRLLRFLRFGEIEKCSQFQSFEDSDRRHDQMHSAEPLRKNCDEKLCILHQPPLGDQLRLSNQRFVGQPEQYCGASRQRVDHQADDQKWVGQKEEGVLFENQGWGIGASWPNGTP
jgi:hypothetical protein